MKKSRNFVGFYRLILLLLALLAIALGTRIDFSDFNETESPSVVSASIHSVSVDSSENDPADLIALDHDAGRFPVPFFRYRSIISDYELAASLLSGPLSKSLLARLFLFSNLFGNRRAVFKSDEKSASVTSIKTPRYLVLQSLLI